MSDFLLQVSFVVVWRLESNPNGSIRSKAVADSFVKKAEGEVRWQSYSPSSL